MCTKYINTLKHIKQKIHIAHDVLKHIKHIPKTHWWILKYIMWEKRFQSFQLGTDNTPYLKKKDSKKKKVKGNIQQKMPVISLGTLAGTKVPINILWSCSDNSIQFIAQECLGLESMDFEIYQRRIRRLSKEGKAHAIWRLYVGKNLRDVNIQEARVKEEMEKAIQGATRKHGGLLNRRQRKPNFQRIQAEKFFIQDDGREMTPTERIWWHLAVF